MGGFKSQIEELLAPDPDSNLFINGSKKPFNYKKQEAGRYGSCIPELSKLDTFCNLVLR